MAYSVFVSHGWDDRWVALQIANNIRNRGADVFIDMFDIQSGDRIEEKVHAGITGCNELISLLTPRSVSRNWVWLKLPVPGYSENDMSRSPMGLRVRKLTKRTVG